MSKENIQKFYEMLMQTPDAVEALNKAIEAKLLPIGTEFMTQERVENWDYEYMMDKLVEEAIAKDKELLKIISTGCSSPHTSSTAYVPFAFFKPFEPFVV